MQANRNPPNEATPGPCGPRWNGGRSRTAEGHGTLRRPSLPGPSIIAAALWLASTPALHAQAAPDVRSTLEGVYTEAQANEGSQTFETICATCHSQDNPLVGRSFLTKWTGRPLYAIWEYVTTSMPYGAPASLAPEQYAAVLAYILRANGYPAGESPLPHVPFEVANIDFDPPSGSPGTGPGQFDPDKLLRPGLRLRD